MISDNSEINRLIAREDLLNCIKDLAERSAEIDEAEIAMVLFVLSACIHDDTYPIFADIARAYAIQRAKQIKEKYLNDEDSGQL